MNIGELKKLISTLPDDMVLLVLGSDHSFRRGDAGVEDVVLYTKYFEYSEGPPIEDESYKEIKAVVVR